MLHVQVEQGDHQSLTPALPSSPSCRIWCVHYLGFYWVMPCSVVELIACWSGKFIRIKTKVLWRMLLHCLMWFIWRERNTRTFEGNERSIHELKLLFLQTLFE